MFTPRSIAFIGAGRVATTLTTALARHGQPVTAIASRSPAAARALAATIAGCAACAPTEAAGADLVFLTVADDAIGPVADGLSWRAGQAVVHCSGATEVGVLDAAARAGAWTGGFHPLQIFSDPIGTLRRLPGSTVAIEAAPPLDAALRALAATLGLVPITLPPGARALYHGGASYAASFLLSMLAEAVAAWRAFGVDEAQALQALLPLARGTLDAAAGRGLAGSIAGPISRGDTGVLKRHLQAFDGLGPDHGALFREIARRQLELVGAQGRLDAPAIERVAATLAAGRGDTGP